MLERGERPRTQLSHALDRVDCRHPMYKLPEFKYHANDLPPCM